MKTTKLDKVFSEYIRRRDSDENGYGKCISCGKVVHWKDADAGHFVNRKHNSLRWNEANVNLQCRACNRFDEGNLPGYALGIQKKHGKDIIEKLMVAKRQTLKISQFQIDEMVKYYTKIINK